MTDSLWLFDKKEYSNLYKEHLKKENKTPKSFIIVKYDLPFILPFEDKERFLFRYGERDLAMISKLKNREEKTRKHFPLLPITYTEAEIVLLYYKHIDAEKSEEEMHAAIDFSLDFLQHFIDSLIIKFDPPGVKRISRQDLPQAFPVSVIRSANFKPHLINDSLIVNFHSNHLVESKEKLTGAQRDDFIGFVNESSEKSNGFVTSILYMRESKKYLEKGNYSICVTHTQTAIEIFIYNLFRLILINKEKRGAEEVENKLKCGYKNILNNHLRKIFQEIDKEFVFNSIDSPANLLNGYNDCVYMLRNKIVHEGYSCTEEEAEQAFQVGENILKNIVDVINQSSLKEHVFYEGIMIESRTYRF